MKDKNKRKDLEVRAMSVVITIDDIHAYSEVNYIISHMNEKYIKMLPQQLVNFFESYRDPEFSVKINPHLPLENQGLQRYSLEIIAILHLKYWCENEERKKELYNIMLNNENNIVQNLKYRTNIEELFNNFQDDEIIKSDNIDYSIPKGVQKYDSYSKENDDIKDYTDVVEDDEEVILPTNKENKNWFLKLVEKISNFFKK